MEGETIRLIASTSGVPKGGASLDDDTLFIGQSQLRSERTR
jgi:hypothetical protein